MTTKQRVMILAFLLSLVQVAVMAQAQTDTYDGKHPIIVDEGEVSQITISGNIDVVLQRSEKGGITVKMDNAASDKVRVKLAQGGLFISPTKGAGQERLVVYMWAKDLDVLTLKGNAFVTSIGVLALDHLTVNLKDDARIALKTTGRLNVITENNKPVTQEIQYSSAYSAER